MVINKLSCGILQIEWNYDANIFITNILTKYLRGLNMAQSKSASFCIVNTFLIRSAEFLAYRSFRVLKLQQLYGLQ